MTYEVERVSSRGNTLYDKLIAQFGERAAKSVSRGLEANARKREAEQRAAMERQAAHAQEVQRRAQERVAPNNAANDRRAVSNNTANDRRFAPRGMQNDRSAAQSRSVTSAFRSVGNADARRPANAAQDRRAASRPTMNDERRAAPQVTANTAAREQVRVYSEPRASRFANEQEVYALNDPFRVRVNYMRRPIDGRSDLEISVATFPGAYRAGMRAKRAIGEKIVYDASAEHARVRRGYRPFDTVSEGNALENSIAAMPVAYRRGEHMRCVTQIEKARPTPKDAVGLKKPTAPEKILRAIGSLFVGKGKHAAELRVRRSPFPVGMIALIIVFTLTLMVTLGSFAELSEYRSQISELENTQAKLELDRSRLTGLVESREDVRVIEKIATQDIGMVSAELAKGRFVTLADSDRVDVIENEPESEGGIFSTIFSAIAGNIGTISEYIN